MPMMGAGLSLSKMIILPSAFSFGKTFSASILLTMRPLYGGSSVRPLDLDFGRSEVASGDQLEAHAYSRHAHRPCSSRVTALGVF